MVPGSFQHIEKPYSVCLFLLAFASLYQLKLIQVPVPESADLFL
jgi:hypothetical protein